MRRRTGRATRSTFALWLDAINCTDPEWTRRSKALRYAHDDGTPLVKAWLSWPEHYRYALWWVR